MHEFKLLEATRIQAVQMEGVILPSPACQQCLLSFQENMRLVVGTAAIPGWAAMIKMHWDMSFNNAAIDIWGPEFLEKINKAPPEELKRFHSARDRAMEESISGINPLQKEHLIVMTKEQEQLALNCGPFIFGMFYGILKTVCIQSWTAIEVLLEDLCMASIEQHPGCFSVETKERHMRTKNNIRGKGGRFNFRSRDRFYDSYKSAFSSDADIMKIVMDEGIARLAVVRNLLVHKSGIVDAVFIDEDLSKVPSLNIFPNIKKDDPLLFDGEIVCTIVDAAVAQGYALLRSVDRWLFDKHLASMAK